MPGASWRFAGNASAAIRQADSLRSKRDVSLAALVCLSVFHERAGMVDRAALESVRSDMRKAEREANPRQLALAATFAVHLKQWDQALALADAATTGAGDDAVCLAARGWAELSSGGKEAAEAAMEYFDRAIAIAEATSGTVGTGAVDARMGKSTALQCLGRMDEAQASVTDVIAVNRWMSPAVAERGRMQVQAGDWESVGEASATLLASDPTDVEGQMLAAIKALAGDGDTSAAAVVMRQLVTALARHEPGNADLLLRYAKPLSRLAGDSRPVLEAALKMVRAAAEADPTRADALAESGFIQAQLGDLDGATDSFASAARLDDSCVEAIAGLIWCQLAQGAYDDAAAQLEMFGVVQETVGRTAQMALLDAIVSWRRSADPYAHMAFLNEALGIHEAAWRAARRDPSVDAYTGIAVMDPTLQLRIAREMLIHARGADSFQADDAGAGGGGGASATSGEGGEEPDAAVRYAASRGLSILKEVSAVAPGMAEARLELARAHMRAGNADEASRALVDVLSADSSNAAAHLLMAQVALAQGPRFVGTAKASLDQTLAHNLRAHSSPVFQFVTARTAYAEQRYAEAIRAARLALKGSARVPKAAASGGGAGRGPAEGALAVVSSGPLGELAGQDRVRLYVLLAEAHTAKEELGEATEVIDEATRAFAGQPEEVDVLVAHARLTLAKGSAEAAVRMLGNVPFGSPAFAKAQQVKADILLRHRRDRRAYIQCFQDVVDRRPASSAARVALSEAYMRISMPEEAVETLAEARAASPFDGALTRRLGRALVRMHDYDRAVGFYHEALRALEASSGPGSAGPGSAAGATSLDAGLVASLRQDLIELLVRQQRFAEAQALIDEDLVRTERDAISLRGTRASLRAMASVQRGVGDAAAAVVTLEQALKVQQTVMAKLRREAPELLPAEQEAAADLCHEVAQAHLSARPPDEAQAQRYLADALRAKEAHVPSLRALARLLLRRGDVRNAERVVTSLRRADAGSVAAALLAAELQMADGAVDAAAYQMAELLEANPLEFEVLAQCVRLLKLAGRLSDASKIVATSERAGRVASKEPGLRYCQGMMHQYQNQPVEAIACFNDARHSAVWGVRAVERMVWLYVCPDGDAVWRTARTTDGDEEDEAVEGEGGSFGSRARGRGRTAAAAGDASVGRPGATSLQEASEVAITLLRGIPRKHWGRQHDVLRAYAVMIRPEPEAKAEAQKILASLYGTDDKYVPAIAAMATLHLLLGETTKAKNQLKHQARLPLDTDTTEDLVRCRLMLADVQMAAAKNDLAIKMCREALARDNASALAWEILGDIAEREMSYADAAENFARAWEVDMERTARVGYKLAFNYLKSRRFTRAIDICHKVLEQFPDYGNMQETIVDVARRSLRS